MTASRLIIWRHGRTEWNHTGRFQGQADVPLDEVGARQAAAAAAALVALKPTMIVSSDLSRARETAAALARLTGLEVRLDRRLREIDVGGWEGLTLDEVAELAQLARTGEMSARQAAGFGLGEDFRRSETGETAGEVAERVNEALIEIAASAEDGAVVVVTMHGLAGRVGAARFLELEPNRFAGLHNCAWIALERHRRGYWLIREYNVRAPEQGGVPPEDALA